MKSVFTMVDSWNCKLNIFRDASYIRKVALTFSLSMIPVWVLLGFDSGVGMLEEGVKALLSNQNVAEQVYSVYGKTFHFSSYVIYGLLFVGLSRHLEKLGLKGTKNIVYSTIFGLFNIGLFEMWYMVTFASFQMQRNVLEWFITDFWEAPVATHLSLVIFGLMTSLYFWADSYHLNNGKIVSRNYRFQPNKKLLLTIGLCVGSILLWIYYPLPTEPLEIGDWVSSPFFPQTHYAYMRSDIYLVNDGLHLVNVITKASFALMQFCILIGFRKEVMIE